MIHPRLLLGHSIRQDLRCSPARGQFVENPWALHFIEELISIQGLNVGWRHVGESPSWRFGPIAPELLHQSASVHFLLASQSELSRKL